MNDRLRPVTVKVPPALLDRLDHAARGEAVSRSVLVREMVADGLNRLEAGGVAPVRHHHLVAPIPTPITTPITEWAPPRDQRGQPAIY